jgi:hypothetical protein
MDMNRKLVVVELAIKSISQHDDEDVALRSHALDKAAKLIEAERKAMTDRVNARIAETFKA